jgi:hypothetical protein
MQISWTVPTALKRGWSLLLLATLFLLIISGTLSSEPGRAVVAVLSFVLIAHCWFVEYKHVKSRSRLVLLALVLALPTLGALWLGLNVIRFYSYAPEAPTSLYSTVVRIQSNVVDLAIVIGLVAMQWSVAEVASGIGKAISRTLVGKKKTWWNRPLTGKWMWGIYVGYAIGLLIASSFLRWALLAVAVLGAIFALIFRAIRDPDQI